jgi:hypothetical protein
MPDGGFGGHGGEFFPNDADWLVPYGGSGGEGPIYGSGGTGILWPDGGSGGSGGEFPDMVPYPTVRSEHETPGQKGAAPAGSLGPNGNGFPAQSFFDVFTDISLGGQP